MRSLVAGAVAAAAVLVFAASPVQAAQTAAARPQKRASRPAHPNVGKDQDCQGCHAAATPRAFDAWKQSKHGLDLVTCVVCHGSTGADFTRRPVADRCTGCHAAQTAASTPFTKGKDCFSCHPGHALDPHGGATTAARLGADVELRRELQLAGPVNGPNAAAEAAGKAPPAPAAAPQAAPAPGTPAAPAPGNEKDLGTAQPHPPTYRP